MGPRVECTDLCRGLSYRNITEIENFNPSKERKLWLTPPLRTAISSGQSHGGVNPALHRARGSGDLPQRPPECAGDRRGAG